MSALLIERKDTGFIRHHQKFLHFSSILIFIIEVKNKCVGLLIQISEGSNKILADIVLLPNAVALFLPRLSYLRALWHSFVLNCAIFSREYRIMAK